MKLYDFDGMFDEKLSEYVSKNAGKYSEGEWEDKIPALYRKFGDTKLKQLGKSPREYYAEMNGEELIKCLRAHLKQGVSVSEFLCSAIENANINEQLIPLLDGTDDERDYAMNLIGPDDAVIKKYLEMLVECNDGGLKEKCAELIKEKADLVIKEVTNYYEKGIEKGFMLEIMSRSAVPDERIFNILLKEFRNDIDDVPMHAGYLAAYGDARAIPYLTEKIEDEGVSFVEFQELKFAIESLGGEYTKERDFSGDPAYRLIKSYTDNSDAAAGDAETK